MNGWFPKLNDFGEVASGAGEIWWEGRNLGAGHGPHWLSNDELIFNSGATTTLLNVRTGVRRTVDQAYNLLSAGAGIWAGFIQVGAGTAHLYADVTRRAAFEASAQIKVSPDGRQLVRLEPYQSPTRNLHLNGAVIATGLITNFSVCNTAVVWQEWLAPNRVEVWSLKFGGVKRSLSVEPWEDPIVADGPGGSWVLSVTQTGVILRPWGSMWGYRWAGEQFNPDVRWIAGALTSHFKVVSSDAHGTLQVRTVLLTDPRVDLTPPEQPVQVLPFTKPIHVGYFYKTGDKYGDNPSAPGNVEFVDDTGAVARAQGRMIVPVRFLGQAQAKWEKVAAVWVGGASIEAIEQEQSIAKHAMRQAGLPLRPVIGYFDGVWPRIPPEVDIVGLQCYSEPIESFGGFKASIQRQLARFPQTQRILLVVQAYDRNGAELDGAKLTQLQGLWPELARASNVWGLLWFSDGRPGGTRDHAQWRPWHQATALATTLPPIDIEDEPMNTPEVKVDRWTLDELKDGREFSFHDPANPQLGTKVRVWIEGGSMKASIAYGDQEGRTGMHRAVKPCPPTNPPPIDPPPPPIDPPPPPPPVVEGEVIRTESGHYWKVPVGGVRVVTATAAMPEDATQFVIERTGEHVTLRVGVGGAFVRAFTTGMTSLIADRSIAGPHEQFKLVHRETGYALQAHTGKFVCAENGGGSLVVVNRPEAGSWETFESAGFSFGGMITKRQGLVRSEGRCFADDAGPFFALGASLFSGISLYRERRAQLEKNLEFLAPWCHAIRVIGEIGPPYFAERVADPRSSNYEETVLGLIDLAYDQYGIRTQFVIFGGTDFVLGTAARTTHVERMARILRERANKIHFVEIVNEGWQTYDWERNRDEVIGELRMLARRFKEQSGLLTAVTDVAGPEFYGHPGEMWDYGHNLTYAGAGVDVATVHLHRDFLEEGWRSVRQPWEGRHEAFPSLVSHDEPVGIDSSVAEERNPLRLVMTAVVTAISGLSEYVFHTHSGILSGGPGDTRFPRVDHIQDYPEAVEAAKGFTALLSYLPADLPNWTKHNWHWAGHPFLNSLNTPRAQNWPNDGSGRGVVNHYAAVRGHEFVTAPTGIKGSVVLQATRKMKADVIHPMTGEILSTFELNAGEHVELDDHVQAYVIKGRFT